MEYKSGVTYAFVPAGIHGKAPSASGVYTIYSSRQWIYVGESDDIQRSLFHHLNEPGACFHGHGPVSFSFELSPPSQRSMRQRELVAALAPSCNGPQSEKALQREG